MVSRGRGRLGGGRSNNPRPLTLDYQTFKEAVVTAIATLMQAGVVVATIAQASAIGNQKGGAGRWSSNL